MATPTIRPPFAWLGRFSATVSLLAVIIIGGIFRFLQLSTLPPGTYDTATRLGLQSLNLLDHGVWPGLNAANGYAPLWVWLDALSIKVFGHTDLALRVWPALLGTLAILTTWLWLRSWFSLRRWNLRPRQGPPAAAATVVAALATARSSVPTLAIA